MPVLRCVRYRSSTSETVAPWRAFSPGELLRRFHPGAQIRDSAALGTDGPASTGVTLREGNTENHTGDLRVVSMTA